MYNSKPNHNEQLCDNNPSYEPPHRLTAHGYPHSLDSIKITTDLEHHNIHNCIKVYNLP